MTKPDSDDSHDSSSRDSSSRDSDSRDSNSYTLFDPEMDEICDTIFDSLKAAISDLSIPSTLEECRLAAKYLVKRHGQICKDLKKTRQQLLEKSRPCDDLLLQMYLQDLMKGQPIETTMRLLAEFNPNVGLMSRSEERPVFVVSRDTVRSASIASIASNSGKCLPIEISTLVYSHCDAESAVALRLTSLNWYLAYQTCDHVLKPIIQSRNPFIFPEGQLKSWGDCLLVFVSRLPCRANKKRNISKRDKWVAVSSFSKIPRFGNSDVTPTTKQVLALELKPGEKINSAFELIDNHNGDLLFDARTRESQEQQYKVLVDSNKEKIIDYYGNKISLSPGTDISRFVMFRHHLHVYGHRGSGLRFALHDKHPLHHRKALYVFSEWTEIGRFSFWSNESLGRVSWLYNHNDKLNNKYGPTETYGLSPIAAYNGVVWMTDNHAQKLVPTLIDLDRPKAVYYRRDWLMSLNKGSPQQCQNGRFVKIHESEHLELLDLEKRAVYRVEKPKCEASQLSEGGVFVPGFVGDNFQALYMGSDAVNRYRERS